MDAQQQAYLRKAEIPFTMVANQIIFDSRISSKAKFYYVYLSSKPNDWKFHTNCIIKEIKEGRDAFYNGLKELIEFGYLERHQIKENGKFKHTDYILKIPHTENTDTIKPHTENTDYNNNDINKKDITKNDLIKEKTNKKEIPVVNESLTTERTVKESLTVESVNIKERELKTKDEIRLFVEKYGNGTFDDLETDLITEYILKRKEAYKSKVKNTKKALTGLLNNIIATRKQFPLAWIFEVENGYYKRTATSGDATKPFQTIKPEYYKAPQQNKTHNRMITPQKIDIDTSEMEQFDYKKLLS